MDLHGFPWLFMDFLGFPCILRGSGTRMSAARCRPVAPCGALWRPVPPNGSGLDPLYIKISDSGGLDLEAWCLDAWMLEGLEWIGGGDGGDGGDWNGRRGLEEILTRSSFRSSADMFVENRGFHPIALHKYMSFLDFL